MITLQRIEWIVALNVLFTEQNRVYLRRVQSTLFSSYIILQI